jgi:ParB family transcriptional regulator, chromosome partitioning protein
MIHWLKTEHRFFEMTQKGLKPYEIRYNDRDFQEGDILVLADGSDESASRAIIARVGSVLKGFPGLANDYVGLGLQILGQIAEDGRATVFILSETRGVSSETAAV